MKRIQSHVLAIALVAAGCGAAGRGTPDGGGHGLGDGHIDPGPQQGCDTGASGCYTVYAHSDHHLYLIDLMAKSLVDVGPFNAPQVAGANGKMAEDVITDLGVAPDGTIYVVSKTSLYTASASNGQVTKVAGISACGTDVVALSFTPDGSLYTADYMGAFCKITVNGSNAQVQSVGTISNGLAISGDLVAVGDGTMYGTAYSLSDSSTTTNNILVKVNPANAQVQTIGKTGFPKLFGVAFALGQVFGFTHDGSGDVITINPQTGQGTLFNSFTDPSTGKGISFAGAGVNANVSPIM
jgi:hypothetical protein